MEGAAFGLHHDLVRFVAAYFEPNTSILFIVVQVGALTEGCAGCIMHADRAMAWPRELHSSSAIRASDTHTAWLSHECILLTLLAQCMTSWFMHAVPSFTLSLAVTSPTSLCCSTLYHLSSSSWLLAARTRLLSRHRAACSSGAGPAMAFTSPTPHPAAAARLLCCALVDLSSCRWLLAARTPLLSRHQAACSSGAVPATAGWGQGAGAKDQV
jgi:hypothetical protein